MIEGKSGPSGVEGWLALLVVGLMILGPLFGLASTSGELGRAEYANPQLIGSAAWGQVKSIAWIAWGIQAVLSVYAGYRLSRDFTPSAVRYAIGILWFNNVGIKLIAFGALALIPPVDPSVAFGGLLGSLIGGVVLAGVWTAYLLRSKRVRNTYYVELASELAEAIGGTQVGIGWPKEPVAPKTMAPAKLAEAVDSETGIELYDRRFDWMLCFVLVLIPAWPFYGLSAALALTPVFLLVALLKPLKTRLGSLMGAGLFAAGFCLMVSPLLQVVSNDYYDDELSELFRFGVLPIIGSGLIANSWFARSNGAYHEGSLMLGIVRQSAFPIAGAMVVLGVWLQHFGLPDQLKADWLTTEIATADGKADADAIGKAGKTQRNDRHGHPDGLDSLLEDLAKQSQRERIAKNAPLPDPYNPMKGASDDAVLAPVPMAWLIGAWAPIEDGETRPEEYCATDSGFTFDQDGSYNGAGDYGNFAISGGGQILSLRDRVANMQSVLAAEGSPLRPDAFAIGRTGEDLIIDGQKYARCP